MTHVSATAAEKSVNRNATAPRQKSQKRLIQSSPFAGPPTQREKSATTSTMAAALSCRRIFPESTLTSAVTAVPPITGSGFITNLPERAFTPLRQEAFISLLSSHPDPHLASRLSSIINHGADILFNGPLARGSLQTLSPPRSISMCFENAFLTTFQKVTRWVHSTGRRFPTSFAILSVLYQRRTAESRHHGFVPTVRPQR